VILPCRDLVGVSTRRYRCGCSWIGPQKRGYVLSPLAAPHDRWEGLVFQRPSAKGQAIVALSQRRSRPHDYLP
jgi:hypothetical protein